MADAGGIRVTGLTETVRNLEQAGTSVADLKAAFTRIGSIVSTRGKIVAPHRTGKLARSIRPSKSKNKAVVTVGKAGIPYLKPIYYGWPKHNIRPNPFLEKALGQTKSQVMTALDHEIANVTRSANT